jgi:outer membrane protein
MIRKIFLFLYIASSFLYADKVYTVDELILKALKNSPDIQITSSEFEVSKKRKDVAFSNYLPKVDLRLSAGEIGMSNLQNDIQSSSILMGNLNIDQIIYDFGRTSGNFDINKYNSEASYHYLRQKISDKKLTIKSAYYNVLKSLALIDVNKESVKLNKVQLYRAKKYYTAGIRTKIDISDAKVRLIKAKLELKKSQYNRELAYSYLDKVVGFEDLERNYSIFFKTLDLNNLYDKLNDYDLTLKEAIKFAYKNRENIKQQTYNIKSSQANEVYENSKYYPYISLNASYTREETEKFKLAFPQNQYQALVNLNWNIYEGGKTSALKEETKIKTLIESSKLKDVRLAIKEQTTQAYINLNKTKDSVKLSQNLLEVSKEKFNQAQKRYKYGLSDYIELQEARQGYIDAMAGLVVDYYNYYNAIAVLDNAIGR